MEGDIGPKLQEVRNVPWMSTAEWNYVRKHLFSEDQKVQREAFHRVTCWRTRLGSKSPMGLLCTVSLMEAKLTDTENADTSYVAHVYSLAILKSIGLIIDSVQEGGIATPMHVLAKQIGIPQWIIDIRHEATHSAGIPSLCLVRAGTEFLIGWLKKQFWNAYCPRVTDTEKRIKYDLSDFSAEEDITALMIEFQQSQYQIVISGEKSSASQKEILTRLKNRLGSQDARNTLISILVRDGFLVPTTEQLKALKISGCLSKKADGRPGLNKELQIFWRPVLYTLHNKRLICELMRSLVTCLSNMKEDREDNVADFLLGWVHAIANAVPLPDGSRCKNHTLASGFAKKVYDQDWSSVYTACIVDHNKYTLSALKILLDTVGKNLDPSIKMQLVNLTHLTDETKNDPCPEPIVDEEAVVAFDHPTQLIMQLCPVNVATNESEDVAHLRGQQCSPWSLASDAVRWDKYPIGKLPGQSDDPTYFYLNCERGTNESENTGVPSIGSLAEPWVDTETSDVDSDNEAADKISSYFVSDIRDEGYGHLSHPTDSALLSFGNVAML